MHNPHNLYESLVYDTQQLLWVLKDVPITFKEKDAVNRVKETLNTIKQQEEDTE